MDSLSLFTVLSLVIDVEGPRERETEDRLEGSGASWPCPFSAGGTLLLDPEDEDTLLRPAPAPAPPSISRPGSRRPPVGSEGLRSATALVRGGAGGGGEREGGYFSRSRESGGSR